MTIDHPLPRAEVSRLRCPSGRFLAVVDSAGEGASGHAKSSPASFWGGRRAPASAARTTGICQSAAPRGMALHGWLSFARDKVARSKLASIMAHRFARLRDGKSFGANPKDQLAQTLRDAFPHNAAKQIARLTGVHVRTVEGWLAGNTAPDFINLLKLIESSPLVFEMICKAAWRPAPAHAASVAVVQQDVTAACGADAPG